MATVYLARDLKHERRVAIKVLRPELAASLGADRFLREIRVAAHLQHPNILGLYDSGEADGLLYYVMPFVDGESLRDRLNREQQLPIHDALQITREVAEALALRPQAGHRPSRHQAGEHPAPGRARAGGRLRHRSRGQPGGRREADPDRHGRGHAALHEPGAVAWRRPCGRAERQYSLGCVLYEMLVGQPPFTGPNAMAIMARHSMEIVPSLQVVRQSMPDEVEDAVMRALEKTPADRFQTMQEFCERLSGAEAEATVVRTAARRAATAARRTATRDVPVPAPAMPPRASKRARTIAAGVLGLGLLVGGALVALRGRGEQAPPIVTGGLDARRVAVLYFEDLGGSDSLSYLADGLTEGLINQLSTVPTLDLISPERCRPIPQRHDPARQRGACAQGRHAGEG